LNYQRVKHKIPCIKKAIKFAEISLGT